MKLLRYPHVIRMKMRDQHIINIFTIYTFFFCGFKKCRKRTGPITVY